ncbi:dienelactone hydrolase family protein [Georgenia sp. Z1491]|uniref:dienelactone hydrolase family protein n=1 Tax=Georgenia sp. Z1491 TaxID=3416707 RepID=UPI003CEAD7B1
MTTTERVHVTTDAGPMPADLLRPDAGSGGADAGSRPSPGAGPARAGIVVVQEIFGVTGYVLDRAADLAALGYTVLVPHLFWRSGDEVVEGGGQAELARAMELAGATDWAGAVSDTREALAHLRGLVGDGSVGLLGFCWGGGVAFDAASREVDAVDALVAYYGSALPALLDRAPEVTAPSLHHWGTEDTFIPVEQVDLIEAAVARDGVRLVRHPGAGHAFDNPLPEFHHARASADAWATTTDWLAGTLAAGRS